MELVSPCLGRLALTWPKLSPHQSLNRHLWVSIAHCLIMLEDLSVILLVDIYMSRLVIKLCGDLHYVWLWCRSCCSHLQRINPNMIWSLWICVLFCSNNAKLGPRWLTPIDFIAQRFLKKMLITHTKFHQKHCPKLYFAFGRMSEYPDRPSRIDSIYDAMVRRKIIRS